MRTLICIFVVSVSTSAYAQDIPIPKPGKAQNILAKDVGAWDCEVKIFVKGPQGPPSESKGVEVNRLVSGGLHLQTTFKCRILDQQFEGHGLMGYDSRSKKYIGTWVDNFSTTPAQLTARYDEKTNTLTVLSTVVDGSGKELQQKQVTTWIDASKKKFEIFLVIEAGDKKIDIKLMEMTATKRK